MAVKLNINSVTKEYDEETTYLEIANEYQKDYKDDIVLVLSDNKLRELDKKVEQCDEIMPCRIIHTQLIQFCLHNLLHILLKMKTYGRC